MVEIELLLVPILQITARSNSYGLNCVPPKSYVEALISKVIVFGNSTFREIKLTVVIGAGPNLLGLMSL